MLRGNGSCHYSLTDRASGKGDVLMVIFVYLCNGSDEAPRENGKLAVLYSPVIMTDGIVCFSNTVILNLIG